MKNTVLETMKKAGKPLKATDISNLSGLDKKIVDKALNDLKKENAIVSPIRCFWQPA